jgi:serine/threonine protein kinase
MALEADQVLNNRYRIMKLLGEGGFGEVYQAWDTRLDACCAVKRNLQPSPEARRQFEQEARMLFKLIHQNLPRVHDYFKGSEDEQYLVMDFVEGENLRDYIHRVGTPPIEQALVWIDQVCDALNYLHKRQPPVVHRDIKPANIIITPEGKAMLVDFGIAKSDPQMRTLSGARAWTPGFAPPEQYGQGGTDARSDVYSLAATAYTLLTGESPPDAMDVAAGNMKPARPAIELNPAVPAHVSRAIGKAMQFNRELRTPNAEEFRQSLRRKTKPAAEKVIVLESQKTILELRQETPPALVLEKPQVEEQSQALEPPQPIEEPRKEEQSQVPAVTVPIDDTPELKHPQVLEPSFPVEEPPLEEQPLEPALLPPNEKTRIEEPSQALAASLLIEKSLVEEQPLVPEPSLQAARASIFEKLGWKGIAGIVAAVVVLIIVIGVLWKSNDPQGSQEAADQATWAAMTQQFDANLAATHNAAAGGEPTATIKVTETVALFLEATATGDLDRLLDARSTSTVQTLSHFREARTATAFAATATAGVTTLTPTPTARSVIKTPTPTPTKKPKKKDDGQITLEPGITLVP